MRSKRIASNWMQYALLMVCGLLALHPVFGSSAVLAAERNGIDETFGSLYGAWRGDGSIVVSVGEPAENISCRVSYTRASDLVVDVKIRCAGVDFKINATGSVSYSKTTRMLSGRLSDDELGWTVDLSGGHARGKTIRFGLNIEQAEINGWLDIDIKGSRSHSWHGEQSTPSGLKPLLSIGFGR